MSRRASLEEREKREVNRPLNTMFVSSQPETKTIRQTYHMDPVIVEAIKIIDFETREGISKIMNRLLKEVIDESYINLAQENLQKRA